MVPKGTGLQPGMQGVPRQKSNGRLKGGGNDQISEEDRFPCEPGSPVSGARADRARFIEMERQDEYHDDGLAHGHGIHAISGGLHNLQRQLQF